MGSILPCFWDRDPSLWLMGPWPAHPPPVNINPTVPWSSLSPDRRPPPLWGWLAAGTLAGPLPHFLSCSPWGGVEGGRDPTCSFINKGRDCSWEEAGRGGPCLLTPFSINSHPSPGPSDRGPGPRGGEGPAWWAPPSRPAVHAQAAPRAPAWASETEDRETRRNSFSLWAVNDTDSRGGWESGEGSKGSEDRGCSRGRAVCGWTP